jgi:secretion/DNA translocation related TadE-like protein
VTNDLADRGSATVWVVIAMAVVVAAAAVSAILGAIMIARHRADAAADAAAIRVAMSALAGSVAACGAGAGLARANGARLVRCSLDGPDAVVGVEVPLPGLLSRFGAATGRARAGPAGEEPVRQRAE